MSNDQDLTQEDKKNPTADSNPASDPNEPGSDEILELTDVVSEGKDSLESDADTPLLLNEEDPDQELMRLPEDVATEDLATPSFAAEKTEEPEEAFAGDDFTPPESSDFEFEDSSAFEASDTEPFTEQSEEALDDVLAGLEEDVSFEKPEDILEDLESDELETEEPQVEQTEQFPSDDEEPDEEEKPMDVPTGLNGNDDDHEKPESVATHDISGISEEKLKELLTEVIQETVDKAVRETVSEVAEKVIQEAIDALKQSIASSDT